VEAARREAVEDRVEPGQLEAALLRLERRPREDADRERAATGLLHEREVLLDDGGLVQPLVGVPVAAVEQVREAPDDWLVAVGPPGPGGGRDLRDREQAAGKRDVRGGAQGGLDEAAT